METISDIVQFIREELPTVMEGFKHGELWVIDTTELADRIDDAFERELIVLTSKAAAEGYAAGKDDRYEN